MLIPVEWLKEFVDVADEPEVLADRLTVTGNEIEEIRDSAGGPVFYLKLTPNRGDMLAIRGAGREVAALYDCSFRDTALTIDTSGPAEPSVRIEVEAADLCPRYVARVIRNVKVGPSPEWLKARLEAVGLRSISNVVDVTNYVMFELGQPLHAFDLDLLAEHRIVVRRAAPGEQIVAIDGSEVALQPEMLVIADATHPVAIAGVMGGRETEVSEGTTSILLESAYFDPTSVRRTSKRTGVSSPSSYRFERGIDPSGVRAAADRAAQLIAELSGGTISETVIDVYPTPIEPRTIRFRPERCRALLGVDVSDADAERFLTRLGLTVQRDSADEWSVQAPTFRPDLAIEEDVIEEVGRMYGYDRLPETLPRGESTPGRRSALDELIRTTREQLTGQGMHEAVTNTLVSEALLHTSKLGASPAWPSAESRILGLRNPLSEEFNTLRPSLLPGLLQATVRNFRRGTREVFLFESGYCYSRGASPSIEDLFDGGRGWYGSDQGTVGYRVLVAGVLLGSRWSETWSAPRDLGTDFFTAKGAVEALVRALGIRELAAEPANHPAFHPGRSAWLSAGGTRLGIVGELHPEVAEALDLPRGVYAFELDGYELLRHQATGEVRYAAPSRFPRALRDLAVVVDTTVPSAKIEAILREVTGEYAYGIRLFDAYAGKGVPEGKVSLAYALELGAEDRTLTDEEVESRLETARRRLTSELGAEFRG